METKSNVPMLSPPAKPAPAEPAPTGAKEENDFLWEDTLPSDSPNLTAESPPPLTEETESEQGSQREITQETAATATEERTAAEEAARSREESVRESTADAEYGTGGDPVRFLLRTGMILLGLFSAVILVISALDGVDRLLEKGAARLILGEMFGGEANISVIPSDTAPPPLKEPMNLATLPANEQETHSKEPPPPSTGAENGSITIVSADLSAKGEYGLGLINETPYAPPLSPQSERAVPVLSEIYAKYGTDAPVVLILHTHATESFAQSDADFTSEADWRTTDPEKNMLAVGKTLADVLREKGINVIHCEEMFDAEDFTMAYYNASLAIRRILAEYPSVSYILDLHRDSIAYTDGSETIRPVTFIDGEPCAQLMFVVGTDHGGSGHTGWTDNFRLACRLQSSIAEEHPGLMRSINLRSASFNQQYTKGSLLIEMGAAGSCLEEVCRSAGILGTFLAEEIIGCDGGTDYLRAEERLPLPIRQTSAVIRTSAGPLPEGFGAGCRVLRCPLRRLHRPPWSLP